MGASKADEFSDDLNQIAILAKAIAHPARVAIVNYLLIKKTCISRDFEKEIPLSQPTISQHISVLTSAGLMHGKTIGNTICYHINNSALKDLSKYCKKAVKKNHRF